MVFDFDNHDKDAEEKDFANSDDTWVEEVESMREICVLNGIEPLVERSRSGRGAHVWIFFDKPIDASFVRKFGFALLDKGAEQINLKSFKYYDRMLPAQDSLPEDSAVGNLIALPLQEKLCKMGTVHLLMVIGMHILINGKLYLINQDYRRNFWKRK